MRDDIKASIWRIVARCIVKVLRLVFGLPVDEKGTKQ